MTHLQCEEVPLKSVECLRDLQHMYEAATVDDIHDAYSRLLVDDDHIFTCIGTSGPEPLPEPTKLEENLQLQVLSLRIYAVIPHSFSFILDSQSCFHMDTDSQGEFVVVR